MAGMNEAPSGERTHIGFFGIRNAGNSSVENAVTGQSLSVVSDQAGTTTDPVRKAMELLPLGPVVIIDTPGIDDVGELGELRVQRTREALRSCDIAVLVVDASSPAHPANEELIAIFDSQSIPCVIAYNKTDLLSEGQVAELAKRLGKRSVLVSAATGQGITELKETIAHSVADSEADRYLIADLLEPGDQVVLVMPIDSAAPKGRIILPQQMVLRDVLDARCSALVCQPQELAGVLESLVHPPKMVVTDSQAFAQVQAVVPEDVWLTSFSILMARYKGELEAYVPGAVALTRLKDGDKVLVSEGCTHHRQCDDIGTVKLPNWIRTYTGADLQFSFTSGREFPEDLSPYALVAHCGACMLNRREVRYRLSQCVAQGVPVVTYGLAIAQTQGILQRSLEPFPQVAALFREDL